MIKKVLSISVVLVFALMMVFSAGSQVEAQDTKVGIVLSTGGLGDLSFNDAAYEGLQRAEEELGIEFDYIEPANPSEDETALRRFAGGGYDLVIGVGFQMSDTLELVARDYPNVKFAHIDQDFGKDILDNVVSLNFTEWEGSFLAGALAGLVTETDVVGYVGGVNSSLIHRFEGGFYQGVKHVNSDAKVQSQYADSFGDPAKGREIALGMIDDGADVIYHAAGGTGTGVFQAANEEDVYAIGVDSNQNFIQPGHVIASMLKRVDNAVYNTVEDVVEGDYEGGRNLYFSLAGGGVGLTDLTAITPEERQAYEEGMITEEELNAIKEMKQEITAPHADRINEIKQKIMKGEIKVENWGETGKPEDIY